MSKRTLIVCIGLQRSGNHAILTWVESLFPAMDFHNNQHHDVFADEAALGRTLAEGSAPLTVFSFEDSANRTTAPGTLLLNSVTPLPGWVHDQYDVHHIVILRDPYNNWASRVAANARAAEFGRPLTSDPSWELFRANWMSLAAAVRNPAYIGVEFNRWKDDPAYRRSISDRLGGDQSRERLEAVPRQGGGSSFDGTPRPSYAGMIRKWRKYTSSAFLKRLLSSPPHYLKRLVRPPQTGSKMAVETRWTTLLGHPEGTEIFADADLRRMAEQIFGPASLPPVQSTTAA